MKKTETQKLNETSSNEVLVKVGENGTAPTKTHPTDAGWDIYASEDVTLLAGTRQAVSTDVYLKIPDGWYGQLQGRSGLSFKSGVDVLGGVIDSSYTGELKVCLYNTNLPKISYNYSEGNIELDSFENAVHIMKGDRVAQLVIHQLPTTTLKVVKVLPSTDRGDKGFGSSGT